MVDIPQVLVIGGAPAEQEGDREQGPYEERERYPVIKLAQTLWGVAGTGDGFRLHALQL